MPNKTQNYQLNQYEPGDNFLRTDFNEDNAKIDAAIAGKPDLVFGTYAGNQDYGVTTPQRIELGFRPKALLVIPENGRLTDSSGWSHGGLFLSGSNQLTSTGFQAVNDNSVPRTMNTKGWRYCYLAVK